MITEEQDDFLFNIIATIGNYQEKIYYLGLVRDLILASNQGLLSELAPDERNNLDKILNEIAEADESGVDDFEIALLNHWQVMQSYLNKITHQNKGE